MATTLNPTLETHDKETSVNGSSLLVSSFARVGEFNSGENVAIGLNAVVPKGGHEPECIEINVLSRFRLTSGLKR